MQHVMSQYNIRTAVAILALLFLSAPLCLAADPHESIPMLHGSFSAVDPQTRTVVFMDMAFQVAENANIRSANGYSIPLSDVKPKVPVAISLAKGTPGHPSIINIIHLMR